MASIELENRVMKKFCCWKVLTEEGLLKDHEPFGPWYDREYFNDTYESEEAAVEAYSAIKNKYTGQIESRMVLITFYEAR